MKNVVLKVFVICLIFWGIQVNATELTAQKYQPSQAEGLVKMAIQDMQNKNQLMERQLSFVWRVLNDHPNETALHRIYQDLMRADSLESLRRLYKRLAEENPENAMYCYLYSRIAETSNERWRWAAHAVRADPNYYWGHIAMGYHFLNVQPNPELNRTEEEFLKAIEIDNSISSAFVILAQLYERQGDISKVEQMYRLASICEPDNFYYTSKIVELFESYETKRALDAVQQFLDINPDHQQALRVLKDIYVQEQQYPDAMRIARKLVAMNQNDAYSWYDLACVYALAQKPDTAFMALESCVKHGWDDLAHLSEDKDLVSLHGDPRWDTIKGKIQGELDRQEPERREKALMDRLDIPAPDFSFPDMDGDTVSLADLRGKVVLIDFWALWCGWCLKAMPLLEEFWQEYQDKDVVFLSMNVMERRRQDVPSFIEKQGYTFRVVYGDDKVPKDYGVRGIPHLVVIDQEGIIRYKNIGYSPRLEETLSWQVEDLLNR